MYTTIYLEAKLSLDLPEDIAFALKNYENYEEAIEKKVLPKHNFFQCDHADGLMYETAGVDEIAIDYKDTSVPIKGLSLEKKTTCWILSIANSLKNYEQEIEKFLDLISEYVVDAKDGDILGETCYEDHNIPLYRAQIKYKNKKLLLEYIENESEPMGYGYFLSQMEEANSPEKILEILKNELPICFKSGKEIVPLEIGITNDVIHHYLNDKRFTEKELTRAVFYYLNSKDYLKSMKTGAVKIDLQGKARRTVTKNEEDDAQNALKKILDKHNEKITINLSMPLKG